MKMSGAVWPPFSLPTEFGMRVMGLIEEMRVARPHFLYGQAKDRGADTALANFAAYR